MLGFPYHKFNTEFIYDIASGYMRGALLSWVSRPLFHLHARLCAVMGFQNPELFSAGASRQHHALGEAEAHLAWGQIGYHHRQFAFELFGRIGGLDAGKDVAGLLLADVEGQLQQLVGPFDMVGLDPSATSPAGQPRPN